jgi:hypothetical protein
MASGEAFEPSLGRGEDEMRISLARGEILAFRVTIRVSVDAQRRRQYRYDTTVTHQGRQGLDRKIQYATLELQNENGKPDPNRLNPIAAKVYDKITSMYFGDGNLHKVSSPVCTFMHMLTQFVLDNEGGNKAFRQSWKNVVAVWDANSDKESKIAETKRAVVDMTSAYFVPLLERMREYVGAKATDLWTYDTLQRQMENGHIPGQHLYVRFFFCDKVQEKYLNVYTDIVNLKKRLREETMHFAPERKQRKSRKYARSQKQTIKNLMQSMQLGIAKVPPAKKVDKDIEQFNAFVSGIVSARENAPPDPNKVMRNASNQAKKDALQKTLSLEVTLAQAPHFHVNFDYAYLHSCLLANRLPDVMQAMKIVHVRRYRAMNVRRDSAKVLQRKNSNRLTSTQIAQSLQPDSKARDASFLRERNQVQQRFLSLVEKEDMEQRLLYLQRKVKRMQEMMERARREIPVYAAATAPQKKEDEKEMCTRKYSTYLCRL